MKLVQSIKLLTKDTADKQQTFIAKLNKFLANPKIQKHLELRFAKDYNALMIFKQTFGYIKWNPGNIVPGCKNDDRSDDSYRGFDLPLYKALLSKEHREIIDKARKVIENSKFDLFAFMDLWIELQAEKFSTQEVKWQVDTLKLNKFTAVAA